MKRPQKVSKVPKKEVFCKRPQKQRVVETPGIYNYGQSEATPVFLGETRTLELEGDWEKMGKVTFEVGPPMGYPHDIPIA